MSGGVSDFDDPNAEPPIFDSCIVDLKDSLHTWQDALQVSVIVISLMTVWRLIFARYGKFLAHRYVLKTTGLVVNELREPSFLLSQDSDATGPTKGSNTSKSSRPDRTLQIRVLDEFCAKIFLNAPEKLLLANKFSNAEAYESGVEAVAAEAGISREEVESYINFYRDRLKCEVLIKKYCEELWKALTMFCVSCLGFWALWGKRWIHDPRWLFVQFPQRFPYEIATYYYVGWGYHGHRLIFQFFDTTRKDFVATLIHHWITIFLIMASYVLGFTEIGAFVMLVHDNTDATISLAKLIRWENFKKLQYVMFVVLAVSWIGGRIIVFFWKIIYPVIFLSYPTYRGCYQYTVWFWSFAGGLVGLWILHNYWAVFLFQAMFSIIGGKKPYDPRSDAEATDNKKEN